jgi:hypothetical protein
MTIAQPPCRLLLGLALFCVLFTPGCKSGNTSQPGSGQPPFMSAVAGTAPAPGDEAPPADKTGGFDGKRAFDQVAKQVSFGPRPPGSAAIKQLQDYLIDELKSQARSRESFFSARTTTQRKWIISWGRMTPVPRLP